MGFNYAREKRKFDEKWKKLEDWYRKSGMSEDAIREMREYDWNELKARRCYENKRDEGGTDIEEIAEPETERKTSGRYGWIEDLSNPALVHKLSANTDANEPFARRIQTSKTVYLNQGNGRLNQAKQRQAIQYNWIKPY